MQIANIEGWKFRGLSRVECGFPAPRVRSVVRLLDVFNALKRFKGIEDVAASPTHDAALPDIELFGVNAKLRGTAGTGG